MSDYKPLACLPVLPLRGIVVFPGCVTHFDVGRSRSARAVEEAMRADQMIFLVAQRDVQCDEPKKTDLYSVGTVAYVRQILRLPGDNMRILVEGKYRAQLTDMIHAEPYLFARSDGAGRAGLSRRRTAHAGARAAGRTSCLNSLSIWLSNPGRKTCCKALRPTTRASWPISSPRTRRSATRTSSACSKRCRPFTGWSCASA